MRIALGRRGDYAVRAALHLARTHEQGRQKSSQIALAMDIPEKYLPQVLATLVRAGLVASVAGPQGGYRLAKEPASISLAQVIEAAEGPITSEECLVRGGACQLRDVCAVHETWASAQQSLVKQLGGTSLAQLADHGHRVRARRKR